MSIKVPYYAKNLLGCLVARKSKPVVEDGAENRYFKPPTQTCFESIGVAANYVSLNCGLIDTLATLCQHKQTLLTLSCKPCDLRGGGGGVGSEELSMRKLGTYIGSGSAELGGLVKNNF